MSVKEKNEPRRHALFITLVYAILGAAWIFGSDYVVALIAAEASELAAFQRIKGLFYVVLTAGILFGLINRALRTLHESERDARRGEAASRELTAYLNAIIRATPIAVFDLDAQARVHSLWNPAAQAMFGYQPEEVIGQSPNLISNVQWNLLDSTRRAVISGEPVQMLEADLLRKDGSTFPASITAATLDTEEPIVVVTVNDLSEVQRTLRRLEAALEEREVLLREIHHRVKNNLQIISSLLALERRSVDEDASDPGGAGRDGPGRTGLDRALSHVRTIARIHEQLYHSADFAHVDLAKYLHGLAGEIVVSRYADRVVRLNSQFDPMEVGIDEAIPLGLIFHELLAEACTRAAHASDDPVVDVVLTRTDASIELRVSDNGEPDGKIVGEPNDDLDMFLVRALTDQIRGTIETTDHDGHSVSLRAVLTSPQQSK